MNKRIEGWFIRIVCVTLPLGLSALVGATFLSRCSDAGVYESPIKIVKRERVLEGSQYDVWRVSEYHLHQVRYDTVFQRTTWDTAHEIPR